MPRTQYYAAVSLDGYIADADNSLDWLFQAGSSAGKENRFAAFFSQVGAMVMGAETYRWALEHDGLLRNPGKWREYYAEVPCWVFTHATLPAVPGADLRFVKGEVLAVHQEMMRVAGGKNVWIVGGGDLAGQFADHDLIDEIWLGTAPVILGSGRPLLPRRITAPELTLTAVEHDEGFVFLTYQVTWKAGNPAPE
jgi:dihydrofolate reductase